MIDTPRFDISPVFRRSTPLVVLIGLFMLAISPLLRAETGTATDVADQDTAAEAEEQAPPTHYMGREIARTMHYLGAPWLVRDSRQREEDCKTLLDQLQLKRGMTVCDIGCGNGFYTLQMAQRVAPDGHVYAVDIQPEMLQLAEDRAEAREINNITYVLGDVDDPKLPRGKCDVILAVDVYHEFSYPVQMLSKLHQALKPDGTLVLAEFRMEDPQVPIKPLHKMSKPQVMKELTANRFKLVRQFDGLPWQHLLWFARAKRPDGSAAGQLPSQEP